VTQDYLIMIKQFVRTNTVYGRIFLLGRTLVDKFEVLVVKSRETTRYSAACKTVLYMKLAAVLTLPADGHVTHFYRQRDGRNIYEKGPKRDEVTGEWLNYIMRSLMICTPYPILCGW
jgi:hypothetical protein